MLVKFNLNVYEITQENFLKWLEIYKEKVDEDPIAHVIEGVPPLEDFGGSLVGFLNIDMDDLPLRVIEKILKKN